MKRLTLLLFFFTAVTAVLGQDQPVDETDTTTVVEAVSEYEDESDDTYSEYDTTVLEAPSIVDPKATRAAAAYMAEDLPAKKFDNKKWKDIVGEVTFEEQQPKPSTKTPPKQRDLSWFKVSPEIMRTVSLVIVAILFGFILYYIARNTSFKQNIKSMKPADITAPVENIEEADIDGLLREALASGDLRMAVRIHYLLLLKKLNEVGLIAWKKDKTNRDYLSEIYGRNDCYEDVRKLTLAYELVWYGERSVSQDSFQRISGEFESVNRQVVKDKPEA